MHKLIILLFSIFFVLSCSSENSLDISTVGANGSYSGIVIVGDFMYKVDEVNLTTFDVSNPEDIMEVDRKIVGFLIESIFHLEGVLFIGSGEALHIFEIGGNGIPNRKSQTNYGDFSIDQTPCDPVISDGDFAYVTLSSFLSADSPCARVTTINELRIYDIADLSQPVEVNRLDMINPKGLSYDGNYLFVCENEGGLKVFDKSDILNLQLIHHFEEINTYDAIANNGLLIVTGKGALYQFDYSTMEEMRLISTLTI